MDLFSLVAKLTLDKSQYDAGISDAQQSASSFGSKLKSGLGTAAKVGTAAVAAVGAAAVATTTALVKNANEVAAYGDNIDKASQKLGISAEAYQEWDAVLQHSGTSIDSMSVGMKTLASKAASGSDAFTALGISVEKAASMSREDLFAETITALQGVTDENQRAQLAQELFGRSAMELGPLLNTSAKETQAMRKRVHELGGVMSNEAVKAAAKFEDSLQDMKTGFDGLKRNMLSEFLPSLTNVMDGLTDLFTGKGIGKISEGIGQFVDKLSEIAPKALEVGAQIVMSLADAVVQNLPTLIDAATQTILTLAQGIIQQLPMIIETGLQILVSLAQGIADNLPTLIPTIVDVVLEIVDILTEPKTLSALVEASIAIIVALAEGLIDALPKLIEKAPEIIANLLTALIDNAPKLLDAGIKLIEAVAKGLIDGVGAVLDAIGNIGKQIWDSFKGIIDGATDWGKDLINNFIDGIKSMWNKAKGAVADFASMIKRFLGFSEPEEGPLSNFHTYAPDMVKLFAQGIEDSRGLIAQAIGDTFALPTGKQAAVSGQPYVVPHSASTGRSLTVILELDKMVLGRAVYQLNNEETQRMGVRLAGVNA